MIRTLRAVVPLALLVLGVWAAWRLLAAPDEPARLLGIVAATSLSIALVACLTAIAALGRANLLRREVARLAASTDAALGDLARFSAVAAPVPIEPEQTVRTEPKPMLSRSATLTQRGIVRDVTLRPILALTTGEAAAFDLLNAGHKRRDAPGSASFEADMIAAALAEDESQPMAVRRRTIHVAVTTAFLGSPEHIERITRMVESRERLPRGVILSVQHRLLDLHSNQHGTLVSLHAAGFGLAMEIADEPVGDVKRNGLVEFIRIPAHRLVARGRQRQGRQSRVTEFEQARSAGIPVIASGTISEEDAEALLALGVDMIVHDGDGADSGNSKPIRLPDGQPAQPH